MTELGSTSKPLAFEGEQLILDETANPATPEGRMYLDRRTTANTTEDDLHLIFVESDGTETAIPSIPRDFSGSNVLEIVRTYDSTEGFTPSVFPVTTPDKAAYPHLRIQHNGTTYAFHNGAEASSSTTIPDSEGFEHNDLTGIYVGDTDDYNIQTTTVIDGPYSLQQTTKDAFYAIVRDSDFKFTFDGLRINFSIIIQSNLSDAGGGIAVATSASGYNSTNLYGMYMELGNTDNLRIYRHDSGSSNILTQTSKSVTAGTEYSGFLEFSGDTITLSVGGTTTSATDSNYNEGYLAFVGFADYVIDDVTFESI